MPDFTSFKVLLDDPAEEPALGFDGYAESLAQIVLRSDAQFSVGIFGEWGSGKTTLMRAVRARLTDHDGVVPVWFNAWRYEREPHLIVPLLDTLRGALVDWAKEKPQQEGRARRAAAGIARAAKALLAGMSVSGGVPWLAFDVSGKDILDRLDEPNDLAAEEAQSFYHAGFAAMEAAVRDFAFDNSREGKRGQARQVDRRIVVFVDDLDRCLPSNALEVLESMKVLFDLPGFVFVVGLAQSVIDEAVRLKFAHGSAESGLEATSIRGSEYSKKLFQVPFSLPRVRTDQLRDYFNALVSNSDLPSEQVDDLRHTVAQHLLYLSDDDTVNPREVKRFINSYTIQMKMLAHRLYDRAKPDVVLALQAMNFRPEWRRLYDLLATDPHDFREGVRESIDGDRSSGLWVGDEAYPIPLSFVTYLQGVGSALLSEPDLRPYLASAEFTRSTDPDLLEAQAAIRDLRRLVAGLGASEELDSEAIARLSRATDVLDRRTLSRSGAPVAELNRQAQHLRRLAGEADPSNWGTVREAWTNSLRATIENIDQVLTEMRRASNVASTI